MPLIDNLIARWCPSLESPSATTLPERVAGILNGTLQSMDLTNWETNGGGLCLNFNGGDESVLVSNSPIVSLNANQTISCWVYRNVATLRRTLYCERANANYICKIEIADDSSTVCATLRDDSGTLLQFNGGTLTAGVWTHVALIRSAGSASIVVNGGTASTVTFAGSNVTSNAATVCWIGGDPFDGGGYHSGKLDDICLFNAALTGPDLTLLASARGVNLGSSLSPTILPSQRITSVI